MSKTLTKTLSLVLAIVMVLGLGAFNVVSAETTEETGNAVASATVGNETKYYTTLQEAINAAYNGGTVELLKDVTVEYWHQNIWTLEEGAVTFPGTNLLRSPLDGPNGLVIDGKEHSLTVNHVDSGSNGNELFYGSRNLTVKNLTINAASGVNGIGLKSGLIENVTFNMKGTNPAIYTSGSDGNVDGEHIEILNCTFNTEAADSYAIYSNEADSQGIYHSGIEYGTIISGNTFNTRRSIALRSNTQFLNNRVNGEKGVTIAGDATTAVVRGNYFAETNTSRSINIYPAPQAVIEGNVILGKIELETDKTYEPAPDLSNNYWGGGAPANLPTNPVTPTYSSYYTVASNLPTATSVGANFTLSSLENVGGENYVAQIGDTKYTTLQDAVNAVNNDGVETTILVLKDCVDGGVGLYRSKANYPAATNKNIVIDFQGHTVTIANPLAGSPGYETQSFHLEMGNTVTLKNGTLNSETAKMLVQNYSNLTLDGMTLTLNIPNYTSAYTLSNNNGDVTIKNTTINANPAGGFAFDVCRYASYPSVSVTVQGSSAINGNIEVSASKSDEKDGFSLNWQSGSLNGDIVLDSSVSSFINLTNDKSWVKSVNKTLSVSEGYMWVNVDGSYRLAKIVAQIGTTGYATLADAIAALPTGNGTAPAEATVIKLLADTNGGFDFGNSSGTTAVNAILDLDGHTLTLGPAIGSTGTETNGLRVLAYSKLEIKNGTVTNNDVANKQNKRVAFPLVNYSEMTLTDVTVRPYAQASLAINNRGKLTLQGNTTVNNPTSYNSYGGWPSSTPIAITNDPYNYHYTDVNASVNVADSTVTVGNMMAELYGNSQNSGTVEFNISAGQFGTVYNDGKTARTVVGNISGGTFSSDPSKYVVSTRIAVEQADGSFKVVNRPTVVIEENKVNNIEITQPTAEEIKSTTEANANTVGAVTQTQLDAEKVADVFAGVLAKVENTPAASAITTIELVIESEPNENPEEGTVAYEVDPFAVAKANGTEIAKVRISNDQLANDAEFSITVPVPPNVATNGELVQIHHVGTDRNGNAVDETLYGTVVNGTVTFKVSSFSTITIQKSTKNTKNLTITASVNGVTEDTEDHAYPVQVDTENEMVLSISGGTSSDMFQSADIYLPLTTETDEHLVDQITYVSVAKIDDAYGLTATERDGYLQLTVTTPNGIGVALGQKLNLVKVTFKLDGTAAYNTPIEIPFYTTKLTTVGLIGETTTTYPTLVSASVKNATTHTVNFDGNAAIDTNSTVDGVPTEMTDVGHNATISAPTAPSRPGYRFIGWYKDASAVTGTNSQDATGAFNFTTDTITANTTLYAKWYLEPYTATIENMDGGVAAANLPSDVEFNFNSNNAFSGDQVTAPTGYTFVGYIVKESAEGSVWTTNSITGTQASSGISTNGNVVENDNSGTVKYYTPDQLNNAHLYGNVTLQPVYTLKSYTISYNTYALNASTGELTVGDGSMTYTIETASISIADPSVNGYQFSGWTPSGVNNWGTAKIDSLSNYSLNTTSGHLYGHVTLTAAINPSEYTVTLTSDMWPTGTENKTVNYMITDGTITVSDANLYLNSAMSGYRFVSYELVVNDASGSGWGNSNAQNIDNTSHNLFGNVTLKVKYEVDATMKTTAFKYGKVLDGNDTVTYDLLLVAANVPQGSVIKYDDNLMFVSTDPAYKYAYEYDLEDNVYQKKRTLDSNNQLYVYLVPEDTETTALLKIVKADTDEENESITADGFRNGDVLVKDDELGLTAQDIAAVATMYNSGAYSLADIGIRERLVADGFATDIASDEVTLAFGTVDDIAAVVAKINPGT